MADKLRIDAVAMVRAIRDRHARLLTGKSEKEIEAFYAKMGAEPSKRRPVHRKRRSVATTG